MKRFLFITILLWLASEAVVAQRTTTRYLSLNCSIQQVGSSSGKPHVSCNCSDPAGTYDASNVAVGDTLYFNDGGVGYALPIDSIVTPGVPTLVVRADWTGLGLVLVPTGRGGISRSAVNGLKGTIAGLTAADNQYLEEDFVSNISGAISFVSLYKGTTTKFAADTDVAPDTTGAPSTSEIEVWNYTTQDTNWLNSIIFYTGGDDSTAVITYIYFIDGDGNASLLESPSDPLNLTRRIIPSPAFANAAAPLDSEALTFINALSPPALPSTIFVQADGAVPGSGTSDNPETVWVYDGTNVTRVKDFPRKFEVPGSAFADSTAATGTEVLTWLGSNPKAGNYLMAYHIGSGTVDKPDFAWWIAGDTNVGYSDIVTIKEPSGISDGDKTDIDVSSSGSVWTIDTSAVTWLKLAQAVKDSIAAGRGTYTDTMYVLAFGQSNMLGWQAGGDTLSDLRVQVWNDTLWKTAYLGQHPFRVSIGVRWNNLAFHFCRKLAEDRDVIVRLILNAEANRPIEDWVPSTATKYVQIEAAIAAAGVPRIDAILMHQGEANGDLSGSWCNNDTCYQAKLDSLIDQFRAESWVPESAPFIAGAVIDLKNPGRNNVLSALGDDGKQNTMFIPNTDIAFDTDSVHYTGAGLEAFGKRYYSYYRERNNSINLASTEVYGVLPIESGGTGLSSVGSEYSALKTVGGVATWGGVVNGNTTAGYIPRMTDDAGKYLRNSPFQTDGETTALGASPSSFSRLRIGANKSLSLAGLNGATVYIPAQTTTDTSTASGATENYQTAFSILRPTFAASKGPVTYSIGSTFYINNSPAAGTNVTINTPWSIWVDAGNTRLDGGLHVGGSPFSTTTGVINASVGYRIADAATSGNYLRGNGTNFVSSAIQSSDIPDIGATYFKQGGNSFGASATLGTNDANSLNFETNNVTYATLSSGGGFGLTNSRLSVFGSGVLNSTPAAQITISNTSALQAATMHMDDSGNFLVTANAPNIIGSTNTGISAGNVLTTNASDSARHKATNYVEIGRTLNKAVFDSDSTIIFEINAVDVLTAKPTGQIIFKDYVLTETTTSPSTGVVSAILPVDCALASKTVNPPAAPVAGDWFAVSDSRGNAGTNNITIDFTTATQNLHGASANYVMNADADFVKFTYVNSTVGWIKTN